MVYVSTGLGTKALIQTWIQNGFKVQLRYLPAQILQVSKDLGQSGPRDAQKMRGVPSTTCWRGRRADLRRPATTGCLLLGLRSTQNIIEQNSLFSFSHYTSVMKRIVPSVQIQTTLLKNAEAENYATLPWSRQLIILFLVQRKMAKKFITLCQ